nr:pistil-specific extensin-like protein [Aegilops tauschii subsp. strangulata]
MSPSPRARRPASSLRRTAAREPLPRRPHPRPELTPPWPPPSLHPPPPGRAGSARALPEHAGTRARQPPCARSLPSPCPRRPAAPVAACRCGHSTSPIRPARLRGDVAHRRTRAHGSGPLRPVALFRPALVRPLAAGARARLCRVTSAGYTHTLGLRPVSPAPLHPHAHNPFAH